MSYVLRKINEMQKKINIINENIEEIKKERNHSSINTKKDNIYSKNSTKRKFFQKENTVNKSSKFIYQKNLNNSGKYINYNMNKNHSSHKSQNSSRQTISNYNNNPPPSFNINDSNRKRNYDYYMSQRSLINDSINRQNKDSKNQTFMSNININDVNIFNKNQTYDYFYNKRSLNKNNYYVPKKVVNSSNYNNEKSLNNIHKNRDINLLKTTKRQIKIKKLINTNRNKSNKNFTVNMNMNNKHKKRIFYGTNDYINLYKNTKRIDSEEDFYENSKENFVNNFVLYSKKRNYMTAKNKTRNNSFQNNNYINNNNNKEESKQVEKSNEDYKTEYTYFKNQRNVSIENKKPGKDKSDKNNDSNSAKNISQRINEVYIKNPEVHQYNNHTRNIRKEHINANYQKILSDFINITKLYSKENSINLNNIIDEYKLILDNVKIKNEFIHKLINMYNNSTKSNLNVKDPKSLISILKWININLNKSNHDKEDIQYKILCQELMKEYQLKDIQQLKMFISKSLRRINNNDNFMKGIKKILLE